MFVYSGHGAKLPAGRARLQFCACASKAAADLACACPGLEARELSPLLFACRAAVTTVILDCCFSTGVFRGETFPGLVVVPVVSSEKKLKVRLHHQHSDPGPGAPMRI
jgi:hypothetical protein